MEGLRVQLFRAAISRLSLPALERILLSRAGAGGGAVPAAHTRRHHHGEDQAETGRRWWGRGSGQSRRVRPTPPFGIPGASLVSLEIIITLNILLYWIKRRNQNPGVDPAIDIMVLS